MKQIKTLGRFFLRVLPHINIALAVTLLTLFVTDRFNRAMAFINNDIAKWMLAVFCITVVIEAIHLSKIHRQTARARNAALDVADDVIPVKGNGLIKMFRHFRTITRHRHKVIACCFKAGRSQH